MKPAVAKRLRLLFSALTVLALIAAAFGAWFYFRLRNSLPILDGTVQMVGLADDVVVERDDQGVPTIRAKSRADASHAIGFLHAQERFFQMDLTRRRAAGELSALIGRPTIEADKSVRVHGFRKLAGNVFSALPVEQKELLESYAAGVNAGLAHLQSQPFEYAILRATPEPWKPEDSVLMIYAMTLDLQDDEGSYEQSLAVVRDVLGGPALAYFAPLIGPDDAAVDGSRAPLSPMPTERVIDLRGHASTPKEARAARLWDDSSVMMGSNGFALAGGRTAGGGALLASDMHLRLRLPNIWYRASLVFPRAVSGETLRVTGVTLPGAPVVVAGSNGHIAWGFTNANADYSDLVAIDLSTIDSSVYMRGKELVQIEKRQEVIPVHGRDPVHLEIPWTVFGPIVGRNAGGRPLALKWTAHDPGSANFNSVEFETAQTVEAGIAVAHRAGIPIQNIVIADSTGKIGWTISGKLPRRVGLDGRLPVSWTFGDRYWDGYLPDHEVPTIIEPEAGYLWTANQRVVNSEGLLRLGDGGYERPQRAARIRDLLAETKNAQPIDLLKIQLDTRAPYLDRWHALLERVLTDRVVNEKKDRGKLKAALQPWEGKAEVDSVSYRLVRRFREHVVTRALPPIFERCREVYPEFSYRRFHLEPALWDMIEKQPPHLLNPVFPSWDDLLLAAVDDLIEEFARSHLPIERATWGQQNVAQIQHPFARLVPLAGLWLSVPRDRLPGDYDTPRVQAPDDGASERFVVSPGQEEKGIFHMPGGQSGHPLSPYFRAGHDAWVRGDPTPFLPGKTKHTLTLAPAK